MLKVLNRDNGLPASAAPIRTDISVDIIYLLVFR